MREPSRLPAAAFALAAAAVALAWLPACVSRVTKPPVVPVDSPVTTLPAPPTLGERYLEMAREAMNRGDLQDAAERLEFILALEKKTPERPEALWTLALILADPGSQKRDEARATELLDEVAKTSLTPQRRTEARVILALLQEERKQEQMIAQLKEWLRSMESEEGDLRATLAQREAELKKIKEILLDRTKKP